MSHIDSTKAPIGFSNPVIGKSEIAVAGVFLAILAIMLFGKSAHYLLFHTMAELFAIVVSFSIFMLSWVAQGYLISGYLIVLGGAYGAIGLVDIFHTLTFNGMNLFPGVSTNYPTQFWLTARFLEALALLYAPLANSKKPSFYKVSVVFTSFGLTASVAVTQHWFPATFVDGIGLTLFKIYAEYLIIAMLIIGLFLLTRLRREFQPKIFGLLAASLCFAIVTEFCFTLYANFYDNANEFGHYFRFLSVSLAFIAIVLSGLRHPFEFIFKELDDLNSRLTISEKQLNRAQSVAKVGSWHLNITNQTLTWSTESCRMFGALEGVQQTFDSFISFVHPDDRASVLKAWGQALKGEPYEIEHRIVIGDQIRWVSEKAELTFAADGTAIYGLGTVQDITEIKHTQELLIASEAFNTSIFHSIVESVAVLDAQGIIIAVNEPWRRFAVENGYPSGVNDFVGQNYLDKCALVGTAGSQDTQTSTQAASGILAVMRGEKEEFNLEYPCHSPSKQRWFQLRVSPLRGSRGGVVVAHEDITERVLAQNALKASEESFRRQFSDNTAVMLLLDSSNSQIIDANTAALAYYGYSHAQMTSMNVTDINPHISKEQALKIMDAVVHGGSKRFEFQHRLADGSIREVEAFTSSIRMFERSVLHVIIHDITERKLIQTKVHELAFRDPLTHLPNRRLLIDRLQQSIAASKRNICYGALMFVDLDNFKPLNDTYGHEIGDLLLIQAANRLNGCVREMDTVARFGGDEFVVVLGELNSDFLKSTEQAKAVAEKIRTELARNYLLVPKTEVAGTGCIEHQSTASIGVAFFGSNHATNSQDALKWADEAMYQAKRSGRNLIRFYEPN